MLFRDPELTSRWSSALPPPAPPCSPRSLRLLFPEASPFCHSEVCVGLGGSLPSSWDLGRFTSITPVVIRGLASLLQGPGSRTPPLSSVCAAGPSDRRSPALPSGRRHPFPGPFLLGLPLWSSQCGGRAARPRLEPCPGERALRILSAITPWPLDSPLLGPPLLPRLAYSPPGRDSDSHPRAGSPAGGPFRVGSRESGVPCFSDHGHWAAE